MKETLLKSNEELRTYRENAWREFNNTMNDYYKKDICRGDMIQTAKKIDLILASIDRGLKRNNKFLSLLS